MATGGGKEEAGIRHLVPKVVNILNISLFKEWLGLVWIFCGFIQRGKCRSYNIFLTTTHDNNHLFFAPIFLLTAAHNALQHFYNLAKL